MAPYSMAASLLVPFWAYLAMAARPRQFRSGGEQELAFDAELGVGVTASINPAEVSNAMVVEGCIEDLSVQYEKLFKELNFPYNRNASVSRWDSGKRNAISWYLGRNGSSSPEINISHGYPPTLSLYEAIKNRYQKKKTLANAGGSDSNLEQQLLEAKLVVKSFGFSVTAAKTKCQKEHNEPSPDSIAECMAAVIGSGQTYAWDKFRGLSRGAYGEKVRRFGLKDLPQNNLSKEEAEDLVTPLEIPKFRKWSWRSRWTSRWTSRDSKTIEDMEEQEEKSKLIELVKAAASNSTGALQNLTSFRLAKQARYDLLTLTQKIYKYENEIVFEAVNRAEAELKRAKQTLKGFGFSFHKTRKECIWQRRHESPQEGAAMMARMFMQVNDPVSAANGTIGSRACAEKPDMYCPAGMAPKWFRKDFDFKAAVQTYFLGAFTWGNPTAVGIMGLGGLIVGGPAGGAVGVGLALGTPTEWVLPIPVALYNSVEFFPKCRCSMSPCEYDEEKKACVIKPDGAVSNPFAWLPHPGTKCAMKTAPGNSGKPSCTVQTCLAEDFSSSTSIDRIRGKVGTLSGGTYNCLVDDHDAALWLHPDLGDLVPDLQYNSTDGVATTKALTRVYELLLGNNSQPISGPEGVQ